MSRKILAAGMMLILATATSAAGPQTQPAVKFQQAQVIVYSFVGPEKSDYGERLAETVRMKLRRHEDYKVIDQHTTADFTEPMPADAPLEKFAPSMHGMLAANLALYGTVHVEGKTVKAEVCCLDMTDPAAPRQWRKTFSDGTQRWHAIIATGIVEAVTGRPEWKPPEYGDEPEPKSFGTPANVNGTFDDGQKGWERADNVSSILMPGPAGRGTVLKIRTDLARDAWLDYTRRLRFGQADPDHPPGIRRDTGEGSVAGLEGVHFRSDWIDASPGQRYWTAVDCKTGSATKIFVKGFLDWSQHADGLPEESLVKRGITVEQFIKLPEDQRKALIAQDAKEHPERYRREIYRWYLNCGSGGSWRHKVAPVPPRGGLPDNVKWIQIQVYCYWPPGESYFDNVFLYKDPNQTAPLPEEKARTPNFESFRERYKGP